MINQTPSDLDKFPAPVAGQKIPRGWFGRLVRFVNSLVLHGDNQYLTVKHTLDGQTITPTPALLQALGQRGAPPAAGGATQDISASVTGGTATVTLSGSTSAVQLVGTGDVTISGNTSGQIEINATGGTAGAAGLPEYEQGASVISDSTTYGPYTVDKWLIGHVGVYEDDGAQWNLIINPGSMDLVLYLFSCYFGSGNPLSIYVPVFIPIPAGFSFQLSGYGAYDLRLYNVT